MPEPQPHQGLIREIDRLQELAGEWSRLFPQAASQEEHWLKVLRQVRTHLVEECSRLAVVGTVKSGKSTMINALVGRDLLKRGAGILTAMITRVQPGADRAVLRFKEWGEINGEINRALGLLPSPRLLEHSAPLDLQQAADRELLAQVLAEAEGQALFAEGSLNQNFLLLKSYLEGYDLVAGLIPDSGELSLAGPDLDRHRELVTREATAVYLKDVLLTVPFPWPAQGLELGDCQGSDSPIPQHLSHVLAYLLKSDLVLYCISSRVGLRQADLQFLGELKRMGLVPHVVALLNLDLGEHGSLAEAVKIRDRAAQELNPWQVERLYAFSALKLLLNRRQSRGEKLDQRESAVLNLWALEPDTAAFSDQEFARFEKDLRALLRDLQTRRLAGGSLSQVQMVARGLREQLELARDLLGKDADAFKEMEARLRERRQPLEATLTSLHQTLEGAGARLKKILKDRIDSVMDRHYGPVGGKVTEFVRAYESNWEQLLPGGVTPAFRPVLYQLFQEFLKELAHFITAEVNVSLVEFIHTQEDWVRQEIVRVGSPLLLSLQEALSLYYREIADLGLPSTPPSLAMAANPRPADLEVPLMSLKLDAGWWWTSEVWVLSGVGFLGRAWDAAKRRLGLGAADPHRQLLRDLNRALRAIKDWLEEQVKVQMLDYEERLKFRYFLPLVDRWLKEQEAGLGNSLMSLFADLEGLAGAMRLAEEERAAGQERLRQLIPQAKEIEATLAGGGGFGGSAAT